MAVRNPYAKSVLVRQFMRPVYKKSNERRDAVMVGLIKRNSRLSGNKQICLKFRKELHIEPGWALGKMSMRQVNTLVPELLQEFQEFLASRETLNKEKHIVNGYLSRMMLHTSSVEDHKLLLPESLHKVLDTYSNAPDDERLSPHALAAFQQENEEYLGLIQSRMLYDLLDVI